MYNTVTGRMSVCVNKSNQKEEWGMRQIKSEKVQQKKEEAWKKEDSKKMTGGKKFQRTQQDRQGYNRLHIINHTH